MKQSPKQVVACQHTPGPRSLKYLFTDHRCTKCSDPMNPKSSYHKFTCEKTQAIHDLTDKRLV